MIISLIAAVAKNNIIGMDGIIPWRIPGEQVRFKDLTIEKTVIMGRKTYESIGKPLPKRKTIVISKTQNFIAENCITVQSLKEAFDLSKDEEEVFVAGGGQVYADALPYADRIYLTQIDQSYEGNIYFPFFNKDEFNITFEKSVEGPITYTYYTFERKNNGT